MSIRPPKPKSRGESLRATGHGMMTRAMRAIFEADSTFKIRGRGFVLAGWVIDGKVRPGMSLSFPMFPEKLVIQGIEHISVNPEAGLRPGLIGLLFTPSILAEQPDWIALDVKGQIFEVEDEIP
jgi:hypothetical protein